MAIDWHRRRDIWKRDNYQCYYCGVEIYDSLGKLDYENAATVDHVISRFSGGDDSTENLVTACWGCNKFKSKFSVEELRNKLESINEFKIERDQLISILRNRGIPTTIKIDDILDWYNLRIEKVIFWGELSKEQKRITQEPYLNRF
jgi:hypothetical protein